MDLKGATADIYSYVKAIGVRDAVVGWCRAMMKWPKSEAVLLFSLCPFATCCSQNGWAQVGQETPGKITNGPLCLVCTTSSKCSTAFFNWLQSLQSLPLCTPCTCWVSCVGGGPWGKSQRKVRLKSERLDFQIYTTGYLLSCGFFKAKCSPAQTFGGFGSLLEPFPDTMFSLTDLNYLKRC